MKHEIYFMRHGESEANVQGVLCGSGRDADLSKNGIEQVKLAAQNFKHIQISQIITSPLKRAVGSTEILLKDMPAIPFTTMAGLKEQFYGEWEGRPFEEIRESFLQKLDPPNGENYLNFRTRIQTALDEILLMDGNILIVAHGGVGCELMEMMGLKKRLIDNAEIIQLLAGN